MSPGIIDRLKGATRASVAEVGGLQQAANAPGVRVSLSRLAHYQHPDRIADVVPLDIAVALDVATGRAFHAEVIAAIVGGRFSRDRSTLPDALSLAQALALEIQETADLATAILEVRADGQVTPTERRRIAQEFREARKALDALETAFLKSAGDR